MKKTYNFKPLGVMTFVFNILFLFSGFVLYIIANSMSGLSAFTSLGTLLNSMIFFLAGLLGIAVSAIFLYIYYVKKEKVLSILVNAIANTAIAVIYVFALLFGLPKILFMLGLLFPFFVAAINLAMLLRLDDILHINDFDMYLPAGKNQTFITDETTVAPVDSQPIEPTITGEKVKSFLKSKNGKITIGIIIGIICLFGGYKIWDQFFNKIQIDAFEGIVVKFDGYNGAGRVEIEKPDIDYDHTHENMSQFISSIDYKVEKDGELSNGDKIKVTVQYSQETAKSLKVVLKEESREFEVNGLTVQYQSANDINKGLFKKAYQDVDNHIKSSLYNDSKHEFHKAYYLSQPDKTVNLQRNKLIFVYKQTYKSYDFKKHADVDKVKYVGYYVTFNSAYNSDETYVSSMNLYKANTYTYVEKEEDILDALKTSYSLYSMNKNKIEEVNLAIE